MGFTIEKNGKTVAQSKAKAAKPKVSVKAKAKVEAKDTPVARAKELVDIIIENEAAVQLAKDPAKKKDAARKELLDLVQNEYGETEEIIVTGSKGKVKFSQCSVSRALKAGVGVKEVHKLLGDEAFYKLATIALGKLDDYLTPAEQAKVIETGYGSRTMSILPSDGEG